MNWIEGLFYPALMSNSGARFLTLQDVADELATSVAQVTALVKRGELPAIKLGGRGVWRIERSQLEEFIQRCYVETERYLEKEGSTSTDEE